MHHLANTLAIVIVADKNIDILNLMSTMINFIKDENEKYQKLYYKHYDTSLYDDGWMLRQSKSIQTKYNT